MNVVACSDTSQGRSLLAELGPHLGFEDCRSVGHDFRGSGGAAGDGCSVDQGVPPTGALVSRTGRSNIGAVVNYVAVYTSESLAPEPRSR